jgi:predicted nuclease of predicted toxin-antitoxin system
MKYLLDAMLPVSLLKIFEEKGFYNIHTINLPKENYTTDSEINEFSFQNNMIVITKDYDFLNSYLLEKKPRKLLLVTTGNITNKELIKLFKKNIEEINSLFRKNNVIEINRDTITVRY